MGSQGEHNNNNNNNMAENRVSSKHLFNFRPAGKIDDDIIEKEKAMIEEHGIDMADMMMKFQAMSDEEYAGAIQGVMTAESAALSAQPEFLEVCTSHLILIMFFTILIYHK